MGDIYRHAREVTIWLGRGDHEVENAVSRTAIGSHQIDEIIAEVEKDGALMKRKLDDFFAVAELAYWGRMWIVQEIILAGDLTVRYGQVVSDWRGFQRMVTLLIGITDKPKPFSPYDI